MPEKVGALASSVESLAGSMVKSDERNNKEHEKFQDALDVLEDDVKEMKESLRPGNRE